MRPYRDEDESSVLLLLKDALGETASTQRTSEFWRWKHFDNPFGPSFVRVACNAADEVVGLRAFMQWKLQMGAEEIAAVEAVDTATHARYRRKGIFSRLTRQAVEDVRGNGIRLIFNTPNLYARPGYLKLGWEDVGMVTPLLLVVKHGRVAAKLAKSSLGIDSGGPPELATRQFASASHLVEPDESVNELVRRAEHLDGMASTIRKRWSARYLSWRYMSHPSGAYRVVALGVDEGLRGLAIVRMNARLGLREALLAEVFLAEHDVRVCDDLVARVKSSYDVDYILAAAQGRTFLDSALRRCGFRSIPKTVMSFAFERRVFRFPEFQKPRRLVVRRLDPDLPVDPLRLENWALSIGDLEF
jgi:GNAT superfamily N-acetyltransferase